LLWHVANIVPIFNAVVGGDVSASAKVVSKVAGQSAALETKTAAKLPNMQKLAIARKA
jgi:hypothetical protein